ncbi:MAG TPA: cupin domain-containing protein, partial [Thermoanaerobaculia bacterium]|nr:cupin domain-containing protein [Thermoanaerobaculia bacterium]
VPARRYKAPDGSWRGVSRHRLAGGAGWPLAFETRYFELEPGGFTSLEEHDHAHCVVVLRGSGSVILGETERAVGAGDVVYVAPRHPHQFRNGGAEPFGFLCVVDAERDRPRPARRRPVAVVE